MLERMTLRAATSLVDALLLLIDKEKEIEIIT